LHIQCQNWVVIQTKWHHLPLRNKHKYKMTNIQWMEWNRGNVTHLQDWLSWMRNFNVLFSSPGNTLK
jgi:hypothetical protein